MIYICIHCGAYKCFLKFNSFEIDCRLKANGSITTQTEKLFFKVELENIIQKKSLPTSRGG